jgi:hypothetical protein
MGRARTQTHKVAGLSLRRGVAQRQDSTNDQVESVLAKTRALGIVEATEAAEAAEALFQHVPGARGLTSIERTLLHSVAVYIGCYDADDLFQKLF